MARKETTSAANAEVNQDTGTLLYIDVALIDGKSGNMRQTIDENGFQELKESIRLTGVNQPILVREKDGGRFDLVAGQRRLLAVRQLKLTTIPAMIKMFNDQDLKIAHLNENIQRYDVNPLDEAKYMRRLVDEDLLTEVEIAAKLAKRPEYVAKRLSLTQLIKAAQDDLYAKSLPLSHALLISRLPAHHQEAALNLAYSVDRKWNGKQYVETLMKDRPVHLQELKAEIERTLLLVLANAPFDVNDATLRTDGLVCLNCPERTGNRQLLFEDIGDKDTCTNPACFQDKILIHLEHKKAEITIRAGQPPPLVSSRYGEREKKDGILSHSNYRLIEKKSDRCGSSKVALCVEGDGIGTQVTICSDRGCPTHFDSSPAGKASRATEGREKTPNEIKKQNDRKQEIFDLRVNETVRQRALKELATSFSWPLTREQLTTVAAQMFRRIPGQTAAVIEQALGLGKDIVNKLIHDPQGTHITEYVATLTFDQLANFMMMCAIGHFGENFSMATQHDQSKIVAICEEQKVDYRLMDAKARVELSSKKYARDHQLYLEAVEKGDQAVEAPKVYEVKTKAAPQDLKEPKPKAPAKPKKDAKGKVTGEDVSKINHPEAKKAAVKIGSHTGKVITDKPDQKTKAATVKDAKGDKKPAKKAAKK